MVQSFERRRADGAIQAQRYLVPVQNRPFHPPVAAIDGDARQVREQFPSEPAPPPFGAHIQIFQVETGFARNVEKLMKYTANPAGSSPA